MARKPNKNTQYKLILLLGIFLLGIFLIAKSLNSNNPHAILRKQGFHGLPELTLSGFQFVDQKIPSESNETFRATRNTEWIQLEVIDDLSPTEAEKYVNLQLDIIATQVDDRPSPYPGVLSATTKCSSEHRPRVFKSKNLTHLEILKIHQDAKIGNCFEGNEEYQFLAAYKYFPEESKLKTLRILMEKGNADSSLLQKSLRDGLKDQ